MLCFVPWFQGFQRERAQLCTHPSLLRAHVAVLTAVQQANLHVCGMISVGCGLWSSRVCVRDVLSTFVRDMQTMQKIKNRKYELIRLYAVMTEICH